MKTIKSDRKTHTSVFAVNIDSPKKAHVKTGNTRYEVPNPTNLTAHRESSREL